MSLDALVTDIRACRACAGDLPHEPRPVVHPLAVETMRRVFGVDISDQYPKHVDAFAGQAFDYVLTVCDAAAEACPTFPSSVERIHWSFADPAAVPDQDAARRAFEAVAVEINTRLRRWLTVLGKPTAVPMPSS